MNDVHMCTTVRASDDTTTIGQHLIIRKPSNYTCFSKTFPSYYLLTELVEIAWYLCYSCSGQNLLLWPRKSEFNSQFQHQIENRQS